VRVLESDVGGLGAGGTRDGRLEDMMGLAVCVVQSIELR
jgi:hypothetical protein